MGFNQSAEKNKNHVTFLTALSRFEVIAATGCRGGRSTEEMTHV
ncbi:hypothetical protein LINGRAHAP2_LOCUS5830 [Linum grandiflorum]